MNIDDLDKIMEKVDAENSIFSDKSYLDPFSAPEDIIGRDKETEEIAKQLSGYKRGHVVPVISVYGRSGSGKSTLVRFVCKNMPKIAYCFVNLRRSKTVFGAANLILGELGQPSLKSAQGLNLVIDRIGLAIESILENEKKQLYVLVLDESDVLFNDARGKPSDFIYKLVTLAESLRVKKYLLCIIMISNNVLADYELDDRVRSRIGSTEIFFEPYSYSDIMKMLRGGAKKAFSVQVSEDVLQRCAELSSQEHGDARRAMDLLRVAGEIAGPSGRELNKYHVDNASNKLQQDRISKVLSSASYHLKLVCFSLAWQSHLNGGWQPTSAIFNEYCKNIDKDHKALGYRRVAELLTDLENSGLTISQFMTKSNGGYGRGYRLNVEPKSIGEICFAEKWRVLEVRKNIDEKIEKLEKEKMKKADALLRQVAKKSPHIAYLEMMGDKY